VSEWKAKGSGRGGREWAEDQRGPMVNGECFSRGVGVAVEGKNRRGQPSVPCETGLRDEVGRTKQRQLKVGSSHDFVVVVELVREPSGLPLFEEKVTEKWLRSMAATALFLSQQETTGVLGCQTFAGPLAPLGARETPLRRS
jgi:hypothetical protein